jgi:hypothetical protein
MDVGTQLTAILTDGRRVEGKMTFGDLARAEIQTNSNFMQRFRDEDNITVNDLAVLTYQVAIRLGVFTDSYEQWLLQLESFEVPDDEPDTNGAEATKDVSTVHPFPMAAPE